MISYYIQLFLMVFIFGFGVGSAFYVLSILTTTKLKGLVKQSIREIVNEDKE